MAVHARNNHGMPGLELFNRELPWNDKATHALVVAFKKAECMYPACSTMEFWGRVFTIFQRIYRMFDGTFGAEVAPSPRARHRHWLAMTEGERSDTIVSTNLFVREYKFFESSRRDERCRRDKRNRR